MTSANADKVSWAMRGACSSSGLLQQWITTIRCGVNDPETSASPYPANFRTWTIHLKNWRKHMLPLPNSLNPSKISSASATKAYNVSSLVVPPKAKGYHGGITNLC